MNLIAHLNSKLSEYQLHHKRALVAVSGGMDSMVLLNALNQTALSFEVAHMNFQLRAEDSDLDEKLVVNYCIANHLIIHKKRVNITSESGVQETARAHRYHWFEELCSTHKLDFIVTAHHLDDQSETVLFNLSRGTGLQGASGMSEWNDRVFRPFLTLSKSQIQTYSEEHSVTFRSDLSNFSTKYNRNKIRLEVIPLLNQVNNGSVAHISAFSEISKQAHFALKELSKLIWESNSTTSEHGFILDISSFELKPYATLLLFYMMKNIGLSDEEAAQCQMLLKSNSGKRVETRSFKVYKNRKTLQIINNSRDETSNFHLEISGANNYDLDQGKFTIKTVKNQDLSFNDHNTIFLPSDGVQWPMILRTWKPGDRVQPFGMKGTQKVSDILIQKKISLAEKKHVLVLEANGKIIWVLGLKTSELTRINAQDKYVLKITYKHL